MIILSSVHPRTKTFDFTNGALPQGATLSRASSATRYDASGAFTTATANVARFDYNPATLAYRGLLIEPAAENRALFSNDVSNAGAFNRTNGLTTPDANTILEPLGNAPSPTLQVHYDYIQGERVVFSLVAWSVTGSAKRNISLRYSRTPFAPLTPVKIPALNFDLDAGTFAISPGNPPPPGDISGGMQYLGQAANAKPMYRCWVTALGYYANDFGSHLDVHITTSLTNASNTYTGDGISGFHIANISAEANILTSPVPTTSSRANRAADVLMLNWASRGVKDGVSTVRYTFDDGSTQDVATVIAGGASSVPTNLSRPWIRSAAKV